MKPKREYFIVKTPFSYTHPKGRYHRAYKVGDGIKFVCGSETFLYDNSRYNLERFDKEVLTAKPSQICGSCWRSTPVTVEAN